MLKQWDCIESYLATVYGGHFSIFFFDLIRSLTSEICAIKIQMKQLENHDAAI